ncbi:DTW domain-containing protein [Striga hermonthica]|uniref:tRNA-uridine aminocarboxypropyltransferase n=1 Tax=Striga hermonthica TaxID=68872 RepID=A0A9N7NRA2_STRHE|nr:DTW domain-containing protein [Striga hermonthica]
MVNQAGPAKRPTCPSCGKPARTCICGRLPVPALDNRVAITILQHRREKNHHLNSARVAALGFKNVGVVTVSDVHSLARVAIRPLDVRCGVGRAGLGGTGHLFDEMPSRENDGSELSVFDGEIVGGSDFRCGSKEKSTPAEKNEIFIDFTVGKHGNIVFSSVNARISGVESQGITGFDQILSSEIASKHIAGEGFVVKRFQTSVQNDEKKEFEIVVVPGSVLLFPSEQSVGFDAINFEVTNLIVLDGTWPEAKKIYRVNPWLKLLPHVRLDLGDRPSLYGEIRCQPKVGYLSTIESIVYAMKALGKEGEGEGDGLDGLLDVFGSMVTDQRRFEIEKCSKGS